MGPEGVFQFLFDLVNRLISILDLYVFADMELLQFALKRQVEDGIIVTRGSVDVLTLALGTPEHSGHVRGQGSGVVPTKYFDMPKRVSEKYVSYLEFKLHEENRKRKEAEQLLQDLQTQMDRFPHESVTSPPQEEIASDAHINDSRKYMRSSTIERGSLENNKIQTCSSKVNGNKYI